MSYFKLTNNGIRIGVREYSALGNLRRIVARDTQSFSDYIDLGNRTIQNQNPLVLLLQQFSVDVEWTPDYLISMIGSKAQSAASILDLTSLYNRGKNFTEVVYPESNHNTLLVVPFGEPSRDKINSYFKDSLNSLVPLYPIYTTDTLQRWDIMPMIDSQSYKAPTELYTIVNIDIYALVIGYYRWLKRGVNVGNSPHAYIANFPLMNCYVYHNELVNYNYLNGQGDKLSIDKGAFTLEPYKTQLGDYTEYKHRYCLGNVLKSFTQFFEVNQTVNPFVDQNKMIFPDTYKSLFFVQMNWVWSLASLGMVNHYLSYNNFLGSVDGQMKSQLESYFQTTSLQSQVGQIKADRWDKHFYDVWKDVKALL